MRVALAVVLLALAPVAWAGDQLTIFVLTGQSNALGTVGTTDSTMRFPAVGCHPAELGGGISFFWDNLADGTPTGDAALGSSEGWTNLDVQTGGYYAGNDDHFGPEIGFARMLWNAGHRDFAIVKIARGGGGNTFWQKGSADDHMYQKLLATVAAATANLPVGYTGYSIGGLLYVQGESNDATEAMEAGSRFGQLLADLKADLPQAGSLVGVLGEIAGSGANRDSTRTNQLALANGRPDVGYARSNGLATHNQDGLSVHYDAESQILLGERMAAEVMNIGAFATRPLPAWENLYAWYVADNAVTFDASGAVNRWAGMHNGGAARDLTRRVAGQTFQRAVVSGSGEARKVLRFSGSDLWASVGEFGSISGSRSVAVLCRSLGQGNGYLFDGSTSAGRTRAQVRAGKWQAGIGSAWDEPDPDTAGEDARIWHQHVFTYANVGGATVVQHWIDGVLAATTQDSGTTSLGGLIVGSNGGTPFVRLGVEVAELAVYNSLLAASDIAALKSAWDERWGSPVSPPFSASVVQAPRQIPRFGRHDVLRVDIQSDSTGATTLEEIRAQIAPGSRAATRRWFLYASGGSPVFPTSSTPLAMIEAPSSDFLTFSISQFLAEGMNHFWLAAEPERYAPLGSTIDARILDLTASGGGGSAVVPGNDDPAGALMLALVPLFNDVRTSGEGGVNTYRIPGIVCDSDGVLHSVYDHRYDHSGDLPANVDVGYSRSSDGGATWTASQVIMDYDASVSGSQGNGVGDPCILHDPVTDTLWVAALWSFGNNGYNGSGAGTDPTETGQYVLSKSTDGGLTWSAPINVTVAVKDDPNWRLIFDGPGHGLAMRDGTLVFPSQYRDSSGTVRVCSVFSSDHGATWDFGSGVPSSSPQTNENTVCELDDGRLLFSMRTPSGSNGQRAWIRYTPSGATSMRNGTWESLFRLSSVPDPVCQGSVIQWTSTHQGDPAEWILFGNPASAGSRVNFTLRVSPDGGDTWPVSRLLYGGGSAYSSICILPDKSIGVLFEKDNYTRITFARVEAEWLMAPQIDGDSDGMPDAWETLVGLNPSFDDSQRDSDGDGVPNAVEYAAGTHPLDASSFFAMSSFANGESLELSWHSIPGRTYAIEESDDLSAWTTIPGYGFIRADKAETSRSIASNGASRRILRVRVLP